MDTAVAGADQHDTSGAAGDLAIFGQHEPISGQDALHHPRTMQAPL